jgi:hypothetical protein
MISLNVIFLIGMLLVSIGFLILTVMGKNLIKYYQNEVIE